MSTPTSIISGNLDACINQSEVILRSHPNIVCQICHTSGHSIDACPNRYLPRHQSLLPAYATFNLVDAGEQLWYPNSIAIYHMTPNDGKLLSKSVYSGTSLVKLGVEPCCLLNIFVQFCFYSC